MRVIRVNEALLELARSQESVDVGVPNTHKPKVGEEVKLACKVNTNGELYEAYFSPLIIEKTWTKRTDPSIPTGCRRLRLRAAIGAKRATSGTQSPQGRDEME